MTVDRAIVTVTVTGTQLPDPLPPTPPLSAAPDPPAGPEAPDDAGITVMYLVEVLVPVIVVVNPVSVAAACSFVVTTAASDSPAKVA